MLAAKCKMQNASLWKFLMCGNVNSPIASLGTGATFIPLAMKHRVVPHFKHNCGRSFILIVKILIWLWFYWHNWFGSESLPAKLHPLQVNQDWVHGFWVCPRLTGWPKEGQKMVRGRSECQKVIKAWEKLLSLARSKRSLQGNFEGERQQPR